MIFDTSQYEWHWSEPLVIKDVESRLRSLMDEISSSRHPEFHGRGIVICAGGTSLFTEAYISIQRLRNLGCMLPVQVWHLGPHEIDSKMSRILESIGAVSIDALQIKEQTNMRTAFRNLRGWELKSFAILFSSFSELLIMDTDCLPLSDPTSLFESEQFATTGAVFWPDVKKLPDPNDGFWEAVSLAPFEAPAIDSGQMLINKTRCLSAVLLSAWFNFHSDVFYQHMYGDRETYRASWIHLDLPYTMAPSPNISGSTLVHFDLTQHVIFQHKFRWDLYIVPDVNDLLDAELFLQIHRELRRKWNGIINHPPVFDSTEADIALGLISQQLTKNVYTYERVGYDARYMTFLPSGFVGVGNAEREVYWAICREEDGTFLQISSASETTCRLHESPDGVWLGKWLIGEKMDIRLSPNVNNPNVFRETLEGANCLTCSGRRAVMLSVCEYIASLTNDLQRLTAKFRFIELGVIRDPTYRGCLRDGWSSLSLLCIARWLHEMSIEVAIDFVDHSEFALQIARRLLFQEQVRPDLVDYIHFIRNDAISFFDSITEPPLMLYIDLWERDSRDERIRYENMIAQKLSSRAIWPQIILIDDISTGDSFTYEINRESPLALLALSNGYSIMHHAEGLLFLVRGFGLEKSEWQDEAISIGPSGNYFQSQIVRYFNHSSPGLSQLESKSILLYWPHGFGDWVFLSYILPILSTKNQYFITRFGDDTVALFDNCGFATPLYLGEQSPSNGVGRTKLEDHFGIQYDLAHGDTRVLRVPLSLKADFNRYAIDSLFWTSNPEVHGYASFPFHSKGRNLLRYFIDLGDSEGSSDIFSRLNAPLHSAINFSVEAGILSLVEARLRNRCGFGSRHLCLISRQGYTSTQKNWGHLWREQMPVGKRKEGQECRDFMQSLLRKDKNWCFLVMEDRHFEGDDSVCSDEWNAYSYADVFATIGQSMLPFATICKALLHFADLSVGVPTGPYHLSMAKRDIPTVGIWTSHFPSWYDEPKDCSIHLIGQMLRDNDAMSRPGSFENRAGLEFECWWSDQHIITGDLTIAAVERLLYD